MDLEKAKKLLSQQKKLRAARLLNKKFIPLEKIAKDPLKYGYNIPARESKAKQGAFVADNNKIVAIISSNRAGKTEAGVVKFLRACYARKGEAWIITPSYDLQRSGVQKKLLEFLKPEDIVRKEYATGTALKSITIKHKHGRTIINFKTYEQGREKVQSADVIAVLMDEEPLKEEYFDEVYTRTLDHNAQVILTFTPLNGRTWTYDRIYNSPDVHVYAWGMYDNPFIQLEEIEKMKKNMSYRACQMRIYGQYVGSESAVYPMFDRNKHVQSGLYRPDEPVSVTIDFGVVVSAALFGQYQKYIEKGVVKDRFVLIDAMEMNDTGYATMMRLVLARIKDKGYWVDSNGWYCDPAGRARQQGTTTGASLLAKIKEDFNVEFSYIKRLGIEESIDLVASYMVNAYGDVRMFIDGDVVIDDKGTLLASRIENYVRDDETHKPIDDEVVTHVNDILRYFVANKVRGAIGGGFNQS